jgi:hypothetical protein
VYILQKFNNLCFSNIIVRLHGERREPRDFYGFKIQKSQKKSKPARKTTFAEHHRRGNTSR